MKETQTDGGDDHDGDDGSDEEVDLVQRGIVEGRLEVDDRWWFRTTTSDVQLSQGYMIRMDLVQYLWDRQQMYTMTKIEPPTPQYDELCQTIFGIPLIPSFVESLFS